MAEKERPIKANRRGPSQPTRNFSNQAPMNLTMQGFRKAVERKHDKNMPVSHRDRHNGRL